MADEVLEGECYLIVRPKLIRYSRGLGFQAKLKKPAVYSGVAIRLKVSLPASLFVRPQFSAKVQIAPDQVTPSQVSATVVNRLQDAIRAQMGADVKIEIVQPKGEST